MLTFPEISESLVTGAANICVTRCSLCARSTAWVSTSKWCWISTCSGSLFCSSSASYGARSVAAIRWPSTICWIRCKDILSIKYKLSKLDFTDMHIYINKLIWFIGFLTAFVARYFTKCVDFFIRSTTQSSFTTLSVIWWSQGITKLSGTLRSKLPTSLF